MNYLPKHRRLTSSDKDIRLAAAREWTRWEMATSRLIPDQAVIKKVNALPSSLLPSLPPSLPPSLYPRPGRHQEGNALAPFLLPSLPPLSLFTLVIVTSSLSLYK